MDIEQIKEALKRKSYRVWVLFPYFNSHLRHKVLDVKNDNGLLLVTYEDDGQKKKTHTSFSNIDIEYGLGINLMSLLDGELAPFIQNYSDRVEVINEIERRIKACDWVSLSCGTSFTK